MVRDLVIYLVAILVMILVIIDEKVYWYEALLFLVMYVVYIVGMMFSSHLEAFLSSVLKLNGMQYKHQQQ